MRVSSDSFDQLVRDSVASLPEQFLSKMGNVSVIVTDRPTLAQRVENGLGSHDTLFGLYEGVPLTERGGFVPPLPDVITIFKGPIEDACESLDELEQQVRITVVHEVAHYFGFSDDQIQEMGID